jgi:shikimate kinase
MLFFLNGFMGCGKSHWGRIWAAENHLAFIDLDEAIEQQELKPVSQLIESKGETYFREVEAAKLRSLATLTNTVISCGGGTPCFHENMRWMNDHGITVYITSPPSDLLRRLMNGQQQRPLISRFNPAELLFFIEKKLAEREPFYRGAQLVLPASELANDTFAFKIKPR